MDVQYYLNERCDPQITHPAEKKSVSVRGCVSDTCFGKNHDDEKRNRRGQIGHRHHSERTKLERQKNVNYKE